jgi:hypothetical protein
MATNASNPSLRRLYAKLTLDQVMEAAEKNDGTGFCIACGEEASGVEPDAHEYECESCGAKKVYGAEELLILMA